LEHPVHREHLWIGKTPGEFAAAIAELAANRHLLKGLTEGGLAYYERWQSRKHVAERLRELLRQMQVL
jgi:glycosyltransferase involved in cell wall biosynthesis